MKVDKVEASQGGSALSMMLLLAEVNHRMSEVK